MGKKLLINRYNQLTILWSIIIIILCSIPGQEFPDTSFLDIPHLDKVVHLGLYLILSMITVKGFFKQSAFKILSHSPFIFTVIYSVFLGVIIELAQHFYIAFRHGDIYDIIANTLGSLLGAILVNYKKAPKYFLLDN